MNNGFFGNFDASQVEPKKDFVALPAGIYNMVTMDAEWRTPKSGKGRMFVIQFEVVDGQHKGRRLSTYLNLEHANPKTVEIAKAELSSICRAINVLKPTSEYDLINRQLQVSVYVDDDGYNDIGNYAAPGQPLAEARAPKKKAAGVNKQQSTNNTPDDGLPF
jgi:hypothetical protein